MTSALDQKLQSYFVQLSEAEKISILLMLKTFLASRVRSDENMSIDLYNKEIDEALLEAELGNYITQEEMEKQAAKG